MPSQYNWGVGSFTTIKGTLGHGKQTTQVSYTQKLNLNAPVYKPPKKKWTTGVAPVFTYSAGRLLCTWFNEYTSLLVGNAYISFYMGFAVPQSKTTSYNYITQVLFLFNPPNNGHFVTTDLTAYYEAQWGPILPGLNTIPCAFSAWFLYTLANENPIIYGTSKSPLKYML
jgi:hypothetical protein